jgi:hypothetical protein
MEIIIVLVSLLLAALGIVLVNKSAKKVEFIRANLIIENEKKLIVVENGDLNILSEIKTLNLKQRNLSDEILDLRNQLTKFKMDYAQKIKGTSSQQAN